MSEYKVKFDVFEGPLDLLLYLIKKEEVDIYDVNLTRLATQFIEYIEMMRMLDLEIAGEFLVMASTLMYIKSRELLPVEQQVTPEGEEETDDPRWELIRQLVEYKKFKDAAAELQKLESNQENIYPRIAAKPQFEDESAALKPNVSVFDLINAVNSILKKFNQQRRDERDIFEDKWTVSEKIELLRSEIMRLPCIRFSSLFAEASSRTEVVVTFLAVLELIRLKVIEAMQSENFGEIEIVRAPDRPPVESEQSAADDSPAVSGATSGREPAPVSRTDEPELEDKGQIQDPTGGAS
jgi:segregation and condensation protein A